ncbi:hypothetical protein EMMF5_004211 [Cystobasidiomycetes sp. EMM_F5]
MASLNHTLTAWDQADVLLVVENHLMIAITLSGVLCIMTAFIGLAGTLLNSRPILAVYVLLLWPALVSILVVGYMAFKKQNLNLDRKLNQAWSQFYDDSDRWRIQTIPSQHYSMTDVRENAIALLQTLPEQPRDAVVASVAHDHGSSGHGSSRSIVSSRRRRQNSVSTLASMPQRRGQTGLGLGLRAT